MLQEQRSTWNLSPNTDSLALNETWRRDMTPGGWELEKTRKLILLSHRGLWLEIAMCCSEAETIGSVVERADRPPNATDVGLVLALPLSGCGTLSEFLV